jgi:hypothetical protein
LLIPNNIAIGNEDISCSGDNENNGNNITVTLITAQKLKKQI